MNEPVRTNPEQELFDKLKRRQLCTVLSQLTGKTSGHLDVQWKNGAILCMAAEIWEMEILNNALGCQRYTGTARYHFTDKFVTKLEYLTI